MMYNDRLGILYKDRLFGDAGITSPTQNQTCLRLAYLELKALILGYVWIL
jgi:hypothetical protein